MNNKTSNHIRAKTLMLIIVGLVAISACSRGDSQQTPENNWDELVWDEGEWQ